MTSASTRRPACPACGAARPSGSRFCEACRFDFVATMVAACTDRGLRRDRNEDAVASYAEDDHAIAVVCDGVATSPCADVAAVAAAEAALASLIETTAAGRAEARLAVAAAVAAVARIPIDAVCGDSPACTLVAAVHLPPTITVVSVGDSRAYWCVGGEATLLTIDHAEGHCLTRWIGAGGDATGVEAVTFESTAPGWIVLCTDGLWNVVPDTAELGRLVSRRQARSPGELAQALIDEAILRGGPDNVSVAVLRVGLEADR